MTKHCAPPVGALNSRPYNTTPGGVIPSPRCRDFGAEFRRPGPDRSPIGERHLIALGVSLMRNRALRRTEISPSAFTRSGVERTTMKIGVIGLGAMGGAFARNLRKAGHQVIGWNRSAGPLKAFRDEGGEVAKNIE